MPHLFTLLTSTNFFKLYSHRQFLCFDLEIFIILKARSLKNVFLNYFCSLLMYTFVMGQFLRQDCERWTKYFPNRLSFSSNSPRVDSTSATSFWQKTCPIFMKNSPNILWQVGCWYYFTIIKIALKCHWLYFTTRNIKGFCKIDTNLPISGRAMVLKIQYLASRCKETIF